jgi:hypothetical protein
VWQLCDGGVGWGGTTGGVGEAAIGRIKERREGVRRCCF